jgi:hypothetical protein
MLSSSKKLLAAVLIAAGVAGISPCSGAMIVEKFNNVVYNKPFTNRLDPDTGITFKNPISSDGNKFTIQQTFAVPDLPDLTPGTMLIAQTTLPGAFCSYDFGFTMAFPEPIDLLTMDMACAATGTESNASLLLVGYDSTGTVLAEQLETFGASFNDFEDHLTFASTGMPFSSVQVYPTNLADGFENISFEPASVPEPSCIAILGAAPLLLKRRRIA